MNSPVLAMGQPRGLAAGVMVEDLRHLARTGAEVAVRVTPRASRNAVVTDNGMIRVYVTCVPEGGRANAEVQKLMAKALGVAKTRLHLLRGQTARDKIFRIE